MSEPDEIAWISETYEVEYCDRLSQQPQQLNLDTKPIYIMLAGVKADE